MAKEAGRDIKSAEGQSKGGIASLRAYRNYWTALSILVLLFVGVGLSAYTLARQDQRQGARDIEDKGTYLVNLISLYPLKDYAPERRFHFLRTLTEYTTYGGFSYLFIQGVNGDAVISVAAPEVSSQIPVSVSTRSLYATTFITQTYKHAQGRYTVYEFAKPIFEDGRRSGVVRLGLKLYPVAVLSMKRISLLSMIAFFILAVLLVVYYSMTGALRSLKTSYSRALYSGSGNVPTPAPTRGDLFIPILKELEESFTYTNQKLNEIRDDNIRLMSQLGVTGFEKNQFVNVLDSIGLGIVVADLQNRVTFINEYMLKLIGATREQVAGMTVDQIFPQKEVAATLFPDGPDGASAGAEIVETAFPDCAPGEVFQVSLSRLTSDEKSAAGKMLLIRNVTGSSMAKRAQEEFIAHVAHELMTSLTNIRAYSEMLMDGEVENAEMQREFYNTINQETRRLTATVQNLLNISKMEMGNLTLNRGLLRTDWFVDDCVSTIEASAQSKQITIEKRVPDVMPSFIADKELLKTAVINILGNAVKYTPEKGRIVFSMEEEPSAVVFEVEDTGYGISEEDLAHVFEKFYRSENPQVTGQTGTGLGLAIAYEIVHLHQGDMEVQSKLGEGSRFTIRVPKEEYSIGKS